VAAGRFGSWEECCSLLFPSLWPAGVADKEK
jgi:hypothetical protein